MKEIILYGTPWCADCIRTRKLLNDLNIEYKYFDIDAMPGAADKVAQINNGFKRIPTIIFPDGKIMVEPTNTDLLNELVKRSRGD